MKKIIVARDIGSLLENKQSFVNRSSLRVFKAGSNKEALSIHSSEGADLIITNLDMPGMSGEELCSAIREDQDLRDVSIITICSESDVDISRRSKTNAFLTRPLDVDVLLERSEQLLDIAKRMSYRAPVALKVNGEHQSMPFMGFSENLSASGMLFGAEKELDRGERVLCSFILEDARISAYAEIVRVAQRNWDYDVYRYGIRFLDLPDDFKSEIDSFIIRNSDR
jgi:DNA-binding response OmpR family regulator